MAKDSDLIDLDTLKKSLKKDKIKLTPKKLFELYNEERLDLIEKKYSKTKFSKKDTLRLKELTERCNRLLPSVTPEDWAAIYVLADALESSINVRMTVQDRTYEHKDVFLKENKN